MWMTPRTSERRHHRSSDRAEATHLLLTHVAEEFGLEAFTVASERGELQATSTASSSGDEISQVLASHSPTLAEEGSLGGLRDLRDRLSAIGMPWSQDEVTVREFHAGGARLMLAAVGEPGTMREVGIYKAILGIRRIWRETGALTPA